MRVMDNEGSSSLPILNISIKIDREEVWRRGSQEKKIRKNAQRAEEEFHISEELMVELRYSRVQARALSTIMLWEHVAELKISSFLESQI